MSSTGQYIIVCSETRSVVYSNNYGVTWNGTNNNTYFVSISGNGQYAVSNISGGKIYRCLATN
jgi:hypothetical protein